eukprot:1064254-Ditylum_brightwellii.AAC.1
MSGKDLMSFIPLYKTVSEEHPQIHDWIQQWAPRETQYRDTTGWYELGHDIIGGTEVLLSLWYPTVKIGVYVWEPALVTAATALEGLLKARHKRQTSLHIIITHKLMTLYWSQLLHKDADIVMKIPTGTLFWPTHCHEPLFLVFCLPFLPHRTWQIQQCPAPLGMERHLQSMWGLESGTKVNGLCKL